MQYLYELAVLGAPSTLQVAELHDLVSAVVVPFGLRLGKEIRWEVRPDAFLPAEQRGAAAVFFGSEPPDTSGLDIILRRGVPVLPVVTDGARVRAQLPEELWPFNCLVYPDATPRRVATALLECAGLLPRQRRVFLSYRREEARQAALQLFDAFSARLFDVFLDTHGIAPGEDFQSVLWHRLCDSDVLVMLDTPTYFENRWTSAEFGRALAKGISILRVGWPGCTPSPRIGTASRVDLLAGDVFLTSGRLSKRAVARICSQLEAVRSQSHAVRQVNLVSNIRLAVEKIGGSVAGVGAKRAVYAQLPDGTKVVAYPTVGVPTSTTMHEAAIDTPGQSVAVVYDPIGLDPLWLEHLDWLGSFVEGVRWVRESEIAWQFADWEA